MIAEVLPSVVAVMTETGHGSGIIYKSEPVEEEVGVTRYYIMTNNHVVEDGGEMRVILDLVKMRFQLRTIKHTHYSM